METKADALASQVAEAEAKATSADFALSQAEAAEFDAATLTAEAKVGREWLVVGGWVGGEWMR
jgi:hypothetical protein